MTACHRVFAYGTLLVPEIVEHVMGRTIASRAAVLRGYERRRLEALPYPAIVARNGCEVRGAVYDGLDEVELSRLDAYEGELYERRTVELYVGDELSTGYAYVLSDAHLGALSSPDWDVEHFRREHLASYLERLARA